MVMTWANTISRPVIVGALSSTVIHLCVCVSVLYWSALSGGNGLAHGSPESQLQAFPVFYAELQGSPQQANTQTSQSGRPTELPIVPRLVEPEPAVKVNLPDEPVAEVALSTKEVREISRVHLQRDTRRVSSSTPKVARLMSQPAKALPPNSQTNLMNDEFTRASLGFGSPQGTGPGNDIGQYLRARPLNDPKPPFPPMARRLGFEGSVVLKVAIGPNGKVVDATVKRSSGRSDCDQSALRTLVDQWTFLPAKVQGRPVDSNEEIVVVYSLRDA